MPKHASIESLGLGPATKATSLNLEISASDLCIGNNNGNKYGHQKKCITK